MEFSSIINTEVCRVGSAVSVVAVSYIFHRIFFSLFGEPRRAIRSRFHWISISARFIEMEWKLASQLHGTILFASHLGFFSIGSSRSDLLLGCFFYDLEGKKKINVIEPLIGRFRPFSRGCIQFSLRSLWLFQKELSPVRKPEPCGKPGGFQLPPWPPTITNPPSTAPTLSSDLLDCVGVKDSHRTTRPCGFFSNLFHWTEPDLTGLSGSSLAL